MTLRRRPATATVRTCSRVGVRCKAEGEGDESGQEQAHKEEKRRWEVDEAFVCRGQQDPLMPAAIAASRTRLRTAARQSCPATTSHQPQGQVARRC